MRIAVLCWIGFLVTGAGPLHAGAGSSPPAETDYDVELRQIDEAIASLSTGTLKTPDDADAGADAGRELSLVHLLYRRATLTGSLAELSALGARIDDGFKRMGPSDDLYVLRAQLRFALHQIAGVEDDLSRVAGPTAGRTAEALRAEVDFQRGRLDRARHGLELAVRAAPTWDNLARLAHLRATMGDPEGADALYARAGEELTAKQMRSFSWVELQRGRLDLGRGRYDDAGAHYERAARAYSGYWLVDEHIAELLGARGRFPEAAALYKKVLARIPKPEIQQALGDLYQFMGKPERAATWHAKALAGYLESARRGEVHYFHHLAAYYADVAEDGDEAERWARKDLALRDNHATREAVAWALYRRGRPAEALAEIDRALASGVEDPHLAYHAGMICLAAGRIEEGQRLLAKTARLNPRYHDFHVHR